MVSNRLAHVLMGALSFSTATQASWFAAAEQNAPRFDLAAVGAALANPAVIPAAIGDDAPVDPALVDRQATSSGFTIISLQLTSIGTTFQVLPTTTSSDQSSTTSTQPATTPTAQPGTTPSGSSPTNAPTTATSTSNKPTQPTTGPTSSTRTDPPPSPTTTSLSTEIVISTVTDSTGGTSVASSTLVHSATLGAQSGSGGGDGGIDTNTKNTIIGVCVGVGGAIVIGVAVLMWWRLRNKKRDALDQDELQSFGTAYGPSGAEKTTENPTGGNGRTPFQSTLESYHAPNQANTASNF